MVADKAKNNTRVGPNGRRYTDYIKADTLALTEARASAGLRLTEFELSPEVRAERVDAYRRQVEASGKIVAWLPPPAEPDRRHRRNGGSITRGQQCRWFALGRLGGSAWSPAFVSGG